MDSRLEAIKELIEKQNETINSLTVELTTLTNNIVNLKKRASEIVALGEKQDECDINEWYSMSPAPYLAELESFVYDIAELEEKNNEN